jgi:uncharacterized protein (UPF0548 family)
MTEWRPLKGWSSEELRVRLERLRSAPLNFSGAEEELTGERGWHHYHSEAIVAREAGGDDCFRRARVALSNYQFSDPAIVVAHFDPESALLGRRILLEIKVLGLHYLCAAMVTQVRDEPGVYGFRYDTLEGHIERGMEWFLLTKDDAGGIRFRIEARWQPAPMPNWWSRAGFSVLSGFFQRRWHRRAHRLMSLLAHHGSTRRPPRDAAGLTHQGLDVTFTYHTKRKWLA